MTSSLREEGKNLIHKSLIPRWLPEVKICCPERGLVWNPEGNLLACGVSGTGKVQSE